jgi:hypothetical protein
MFVDASCVDMVSSCSASFIPTSRTLRDLAEGDLAHPGQYLSRHQESARQSNAASPRQHSHAIAIACNKAPSRSPRFPPSRLVQHLPFFQGHRVVGGTHGQVSNKPKRLLPVAAENWVHGAWYEAVIGIHSSGAVSMTGIVEAAVVQLGRP